MQERYPKRNCDSTHLIFRHYFANLKKPVIFIFHELKKSIHLIMKRLLVCQSYITYHVTGDEFTATAS